MTEGPHRRLEFESPRGQGAGQVAEVTQADGGRWDGGQSEGRDAVKRRGAELTCPRGLPLSSMGLGSRMKPHLP